MGLITTQVLGFGKPKPDPNKAADPKPVRGVNWLGMPMKEGDYYGGRPEHLPPEHRGPGRPSNAEKAHKSTVEVDLQDKSATKKLTSQEIQKLPEYRMRARAKSIAMWARRRAMGQNAKETVINATQSGDNS